MGNDIVAILVNFCYHDPQLVQKILCYNLLNSQNITIIQKQ